jgi:16S rRNA (guanine527-N7)-methyltransferase
MSSFREKLSAGISQLNFFLEDSQLQKLEDYLNFLQKRNNVLRLVADSSAENVLFHILDSLIPYSLLQQIDAPVIADIGSGGGLPGIPLAIAFPEREFVLIERSARRVGFLRAASATLGLADRITVFEGELKNFDGEVDCAVFRAFRQLDEFFFEIADIVRSGGTVFAYKGREQECRRELEILESFDGFGGNFEPAIIPAVHKFSEAERTFLTFKKK